MDEKELLKEAKKLIESLWRCVENSTPSDWDDVYAERKLENRVKEFMIDFRKLKI